MVKLVAGGSEVAADSQSKYAQFEERALGWFVELSRGGRESHCVPSMNEGAPLRHCYSEKHDSSEVGQKNWFHCSF